MERITTSWHQPLTLLPPPSSKRGAARHPAEQLGALSLYYVFQTEYRVWMASLPPDSRPHRATLQHLPQRPPHRGEQRGPQRKSWGLVFSYSSVSCFRSNREWGWPACRLAAVHTSPLCSTFSNALLTERNSEAPSGKAGGSYSRNLVFRVADQVENKDGQHAA